MDPQALLVAFNKARVYAEYDHDLSTEIAEKRLIYKSKGEFLRFGVVLSPLLYRLRSEKVFRLDGSCTHILLIALDYLSYRSTHSWKGYINSENLCRCGRGFYSEAGAYHLG